jgi:predicted RNA-binding protein with TRAM domain
MSYGNSRGNRYGGSGGYGNRDRGYGGSSSFNQGPKPVEAGKEYDVEITELSRRGDGVAKIGGFVIFVKGAKMGDKVKIKIETVGPRFATATALQSSGGSSGSAAKSDSDDSDSSISEPV